MCTGITLVETILCYASQDIPIDHLHSHSLHSARTNSLALEDSQAQIFIKWERQGVTKECILNELSIYFMEMSTNMIWKFGFVYICEGAFHVMRLPSWLWTIMLMQLLCKTHFAALHHEGYSRMFILRSNNNKWWLFHARAWIDFSHRTLLSFPAIWDT